MNCVSNDDISVPEGSPVSATMSHSGSNEESQPAALAKDQNKLIHLDPIPDFQDKGEIKPWLQKIYYPQGIEIVIERSDRLKVVFKCKASKRGKNSQGWAATKSESPVSLSKQPVLEGSKKKRSVSRFNLCPFRIRATYSLKRKRWNIVVVNNSHSHPLKFDPDSDEYKKFKSKLREDNDWEAIKKFDELEYRARSNLPIESSVITCDCGLTNEISSFNIVLPSAKPTMINKPKSTSKLRQQRKETFLKIPQQHDFLPNTTHVDSPTVSGFIDDLSLDQPFAALSTATDAFTDLNEIDFTSIFHKPQHPHRQHERHSITGTPVPPNVFSPLTNSTFQYYSPTDELLNSPAHQRPPSVSTHHSTQLVDICEKQSWDPHYNDHSQDSLATPLCEITNSDMCRADTPQTGIGDVLSQELNAIKAIDSDLQIIDESMSTQIFHRSGFDSESPWTPHDQLTQDNDEDSNDKSFWDMNFARQ